MYAPYQTYANINDRPFIEYNPVTCSPSLPTKKAYEKEIKFSKDVKSQVPSTVTGLHDYVSYVEGYSFPFPNQENMIFKDLNAMKLYKDDFVNLKDGRLMLKDTRLEGKEAFVYFLVGTCFPCQDTKQVWQAFACNVSQRNHLLTFFRKCGSTSGIQYLMFKRKDGILVDI